MDSSAQAFLTFWGAGAARTRFATRSSVELRYRIHTFQACAFSRSATSPNLNLPALLYAAIGIVPNRRGGGGFGNARAFPHPLRGSSWRRSDSLLISNDISSRSQRRGTRKINVPRTSCPLARAQCSGSAEGRLERLWDGLAQAALRKRARPCSSWASPALSSHARITSSTATPLSSNFIACCTGR